MRHSSKGVEIRSVEEIPSAIGAVRASTVSVAVPRRGRQILSWIHSGPAVVFMGAQIAGLAGATPLSWKIVAYASVFAEAGLLMFRRRLARAIERSVVRWSVLAGSHRERITVEGKVSARVTMQSELTGRSAVLIRTRREDPSSGLIADGLRGLEFDIVDDDGVRYAVEPSPHLYFDEPPPVTNDATNVAETLLCPDDRVRVWGTAVQEPSVSGERPDHRSAPMRLSLVGSESSPLVIRFAKRGKGVSEIGLIGEG